MEMASAEWFSEMAMADPSCSMYEIDTQDYSIDDLHFQSFSPESYTSGVPPKPQTPTPINVNVVERPLKQLKTNSWSSSCTNLDETTPAISSSQLISFGSAHPKLEMGSVDDEYVKYPGPVYEMKGNKRSGVPTRSPLHAQDHVIAERKRREKLSQRFIALSAIVPGLKKTDKTSILGDTIKYLKQLEERVKTLEEQTEKKTVESVVFVNKSQLCSDDETSSCDTSQSSQSLPEIEARVMDKDVLIKIHCEKQKGCTVRILNEVEKLNLTVINSSILPFGKSIFDITIVAKMEDGVCMPAKDLAKTLRGALLNFM